MIIPIAWKEYREHRSFWLVLVLLSGAGLAFLGQIWTPGSRPVLNLEGPFAVALTGFILVGMYGLVCGGMMIAGERESRAIPFLDNLPATRSELWFAKLLIGVILTALHTLITVLTLRALEIDRLAQLPPWWSLALFGVALECFSWGFCFSSICHTVLAAIAGATLLPLALSWTFCGAFLLSAPEFLVGIHAFLMMFALGVSLYLFSDRDWERRFVLPSRPPRGSVEPKRAPMAWEAVLWVSFHQARTEAFIVFGIAAVAGLALPALPIPLWLFSTFLIGSITGVAVYSGTQAERAHRLYGDQRLPVGRIWLWKSGLWLAIALFATVTLGLSAALGSVLRRSSEGGFEDPIPLLDYLLYGMGSWERMVGLTALASAGLFTGFAMGQMASLLWKKGSVAVVVAFLATVAALALWAPNLIGGGTPPWHLLVLPFAVLTACRVSQWSWVADRLMSLRPVLGLLAGPAVGILWLAGVSCYRAYEPPAASLGFDVAAFQAELAVPIDEGSGMLLREAMKDLEERQERLDQGAPALARPGLPPDYRERRYRDMERVLHEGWRQAGVDLSYWLDQVGDGVWVQQVRRALTRDPGRLFEPRGLTRSSPELRTFRTMARILAARALQLQSRGKPAEALDHLVQTLALARKLEHLAPIPGYETGQDIEGIALEAWERWLESPLSKEELEKGLRELTRHEMARTPVAEPLKIQYLNLAKGLEDTSVLLDADVPPGGVRLDGESLGLVLATPWERQRAHRLLQAVYAGKLRAAEAEALTLPPASSGLSRGAVALADWHSDPSLLADLSPQLIRFLDRSFLCGFLPGTATLQEMARIHTCRVRGIRLQTALKLYALQNGKTAMQLENLVPEQLLEVPLDPFTGQPFRYRVSTGEALSWPVRDAQGSQEYSARKVLQGQGIVWSVGPDGQSHGGRTQWSSSVGSQAQADMIFLAPEAR